MRLYCTGEVHKGGIQGSYLFGKAEESLPPLKKQYGGKVQCIYLDPPMPEDKLSEDKGERESFLKWMRSLLLSCKELLASSGSIYLHCDPCFNAPLRLLMDEVFGESNFVNEIVWSYRSPGRATRYFPRKHDTLLFYRKTRRQYFNMEPLGKPRGPEKRNHMKQQLDENGKVSFSVRSRGKLYTYSEDDPIYPTDVWEDIDALQQKDKERTGYAGQRPEALLERILLCSTKEGDLVLDPFAGSGTTAAVAGRLNRRFITIDSEPSSLLTARKRLLKQDSSVNLLQQESKQLRFCYSADRCKGVIQCSVEQKKRGKYVLVQEAKLAHKALPIAYAATGTVKERCFYPQTVSLNPQLPIKLPLPNEAAPVLQLVNSEGDQVFVTVG